MRRIITCVVFCFIALSSFSQEKERDDKDGEIMKGWTMIVESRTLIDVSYRVVKCEDKTQLHLLIFNENAIDQVAKFTMTVSDPLAKKSFTKEVSVPVSKAFVLKAECTSNPATQALKFDLPAGYNPKNLKVAVTF